MYTRYDGEIPIICPQPGPQQLFLSTTADIAFYGGAAYGGKSFALLMEATRNVNDPLYTGKIFRRKYKEIVDGGGLWDTSQAIYPFVGGEGVRGNTEWTFPAGCKIKFDHLNQEKNMFDHQGAAYVFLGFDELTHFLKSQFFYLLSRNRPPAGCYLRPYCRATFNAEPGWIADMIQWYWDPETGYPIKERSGVIRHFIRKKTNNPNDDDILWVSPDYRDENGLAPYSFTFISASADDNPLGLLADPTFKSRMNSLDHVTRERLVGSNFLISFGGNMFRAEWFDIIEPDEVPKDLKRVVRYWDMAASEVKEEDKNDPDWTAGAQCSIYNDVLYILDINFFRETPGKSEENMKKVAKIDGNSVEVWWEEEKGSSGKYTSEYFKQIFKGYDCHPDPVSGQKVDRARPWSSWAENGRVKLVRGAWNRQFISWATQFPDSKRDCIDACFVEGTMIAVKGGEKPIEKLSVGELVVTPIGFRKIKRVMIKESNVVDYGLFSCTPNHPVYSNGQYTEIDSLTGLNKISILSLKELILWNIQNQFYLMGEPTSSLEGHDRITTLRSIEVCRESINPLRLFMSLFGNIIAEKKFLKAALFTTRTVIALITATKIWSAYRGSNIKRFMEYILLKGWNDKKSTSMQSGVSPLNGIGQKKVESGIEVTLKTLWRKLNTKIGCVWFVEKCLRRGLKQGSVQTTVVTSTGENTIIKLLKRIVNAAVKSLKQSISKENQQDFVLHIAGKQSLGKTFVYNVEVEEAHCYYANKVLVGNCSGAFKVLIQPNRVLSYYVADESDIGNRKLFARDREAFEKITKGNIDVYVVLWSEDNGSIYAGFYIWSHVSKRLRIYNELIDTNPVPMLLARKIKELVVVPMTDNPQTVCLKRIYCNDTMHEYGKGSMAKELRKYGIRLHKNTLYDENGAILAGNALFSENSIIVHEDLTETDTHIRGWQYDDNKKPKRGYPLARCLCLLLSQLKQDKVQLVDHTPKPYSHSKTRIRNELRSQMNIPGNPSNNEDKQHEYLAK